MFQNLEHLLPVKKCGFSELFGRCHLRAAGKFHPVGWGLDDHECIGEKRRCGVVDYGAPQGGIWRCCLRLFEVAPRAVFQGFTRSVWSISMLRKNSASRPQVPFTWRRKASPSRVARWRLRMHRQSQMEASAYCLNCVGFISGAFQLPHFWNNPSRFLNFSRVGFGSFDATK